MWYVALVFLCNLSVLASSKVNYCSSKICSHANAHTFCQFSGGPGHQCSGYIDAPLSNQEKARVLMRLNQRRAAAASGRLKGFPTAGNMLKLLWIDELEREAQLWADQCEPPRIPEENDVCRDLYSVSVGQCIASVVGEAPGLRPESMVDMWYMQGRYYKGDVTFYELPSNMFFGYYSDFAQLVYAKAYMVGCGRSRFMVLLHGRLRSVERLVCNFAPRGPSAGQPIWSVASPCTACPPRSQPDDTFPTLCSIRRDIDESQDQDSVMTLEEHVLLDTIFNIEKNETLNYVGSIDELYLTKIAIATMVDFDTIGSDFSSLQKRDIIEHVDLTTNIMDDIFSVEAIEQLFTTTEIVTVFSNIEVFKFPKEKVKLIGRPKSYNMEDLTNSGVNTKTENSNMLDLPNRDTSFDVDYEFVEEIASTNSTHTKITTYVVITTNESTALSEVYESHTETANETKSLEREENSSLCSTGDTEESIKDFNSSNITTLSVNDTDAIIDEYLNDPETFRQLQEELERMERTISMSTILSTTERSDKVRRDLRDRSTEIGKNKKNSVENSTFNTQHLVDVFSQGENNGTLDQTPMLNMVMRYMPYLKGYKNGLLKSAVGRAYRRNVVYNFTFVLTLIITIVW